MKFRSFPFIPGFDLLDEMIVQNYAYSVFMWWKDVNRKWWIVVQGGILLQKGVWFETSVR